MSEKIQTFGKKKKAIAVAQVTKGKGIVKVNGTPLELVQPEVLRFKLFEPILLLGKDKFQGIDIRVRVRGGGPVAQVFAIRQVIAKSVIAWFQKYVDEATKRELKTKLIEYDRSLLVADPRRREPKQPGGRKARSKKQKSYR